MQCHCLQNSRLLFTCIIACYTVGAPSLVNSGSGVGATELLSPARGELHEFDYTQGAEQLAVHTAELLRDRRRLEDVGRRAAAKAVSWTENAAAESLQRLLAKIAHQA